MGPKIKVLPPEVVNKIAAGEVIQRPASVVKELVENSIDAQATQIEIRVKEGGKELIQVIDNGVGMNREEAQLALKRHATSKINEANDLFSIRSLGFRGEALPSIAAISRLELRTRSEEELAGTMLQVAGSEILKVKDIGTPVGTNLIVKDLFYNTPVRYKYLKTTGTEISRISDIINRLILADSQISFSLIHNQKKLLESPGSGNLLDAIFSIYGKEISENLVPITYEDSYMQLKGYLSKPQLTRAGAKYQSYFINGRFIKSQLLSRALSEGYQSLIPKGRYPIAVLMIKLNPVLVDVNVHPQKMEVNFSRQEEIYRVIKEGVKEALAEADLSKKLKLMQEQKSKVPATNKKEKIKQQSLKLGKVKEDNQELKQEAEQKSYESSKVETDIEKQEATKVEEAELNYQEQIEEEGLSSFFPLGQIDNTYLIAQGPDGLYIIDQHAAHERIIYNRLLKKAQQSKVQSQSLLVPIKLELTRGEIEVFKEKEKQLQSLGFEVEHFGGQSYLIRAVPQLIGELETKKICTDLIEELVQTGKTKQQEELIKNLATLLSCQSAIKSGKSLEQGEMESLMAQLESTENKYSCPHGRPTILHLSEAELSKKFKRT